MSDKRLLVQSCSARKRAVDEALPALDLYDGYFYRIINKSRREGRFDNSIDIVILSAKHGLLAPNEEIEPYDREMNPDRADQLNETVVEELAATIRADDYDEVWINGAAVYRRALEGIDEVVDVPVHYIEGNGNGEMGSQLKDLITREPVRGDD
jgi:hypothetical protein